jgi:serine protease Do
MAPALGAQDSPEERPCGQPTAERTRGEGFAAAVARNAPAVVQVVVLRGARDPMEEAQGFEFFQPLAGLPLQGGDARAAGDATATVGNALERTFSSGFIIDPAGYLLTSAHAVYDAHEIWVFMEDGRRLRASVAGLDRRTDVALLKVDAIGLPAVRLALPPRLCPGAWLAALGTPFGFERTVTAGVISAYPRYFPGSTTALIQSDVVLNPGSSGGPLFDADGTVIGMSSMIYSGSGIYIGLSFALPIDEVMRIVDGLQSSRGAARGDIGVRLQSLTRELAVAFGLREPAGALVVGVEPGSAAQKAGLRSGDVILAVGDEKAQGQSRVEERIAAAEPGSGLQVQVWRNQSARRLLVRVAAAQLDKPPVMRARDAAARAHLGLGFAPTKVTAGMPAGLYVETATGAALLAGLERGDRIAAVNGTPVQTPAEFDAAVQATGTRAVVALLIVRGPNSIYLAVVR